MLSQFRFNFDAFIFFGLTSLVEILGEVILTKIFDVSSYEQLPILMIRLLTILLAIYQMGMGKGWEQLKQ